jgi:hypothetical protein
MGGAIHITRTTAGAFSSVDVRINGEVFTKVTGKKSRGCAYSTTGGFEFHFDFF